MNVKRLHKKNTAVAGKSQYRFNTLFFINGAMLLCVINLFLCSLGLTDFKFAVSSLICRWPLGLFLVIAASCIIAWNSPKMKSNQRIIFNCLILPPIIGYIFSILMSAAAGTFSFDDFIYEMYGFPTAFAIGLIFSRLALIKAGIQKKNPTSKNIFMLNIGIWLIAVGVMALMYALTRTSWYDSFSMFANSGMYIDDSNASILRNVCMIFSVFVSGCGLLSIVLYLKVRDS
jgi:hypothetical protein